MAMMRNLTLVCFLLCSMLADSSSAFLARSHLVAFAGFGGGGGKLRGKGRKKKSAKKVKKNPLPPNLFTPEGRMAHIQSRIKAADFSSIAKLTLIPGKDDQVSLDIDPNAVCVVDNFLGTDFVAAMRSEAESLIPTMVPSMSTRWDEETQKVVPYEKHQVKSMQIEGGTEGYAASPRLVEYIVTLTQSLTAQLNRLLPEIYQLSGEEQTNKLAVCLGDGSRYDKHIDNGGGSDRRKLTALLYLQPPEWHDGGGPGYPYEMESDDTRGGYFRAYDVPEKGEVTSIAPKGDRLLLFWSDSLVHDVSPSFAPNGDDDRRWALTIWLVVDKNGQIRSYDSDIEGRHFGKG